MHILKIKSLYLIAIQNRDYIYKKILRINNKIIINLSNYDKLPQEKGDSVYNTI